MISSRFINHSECLSNATVIYLTKHYDIARTDAGFMCLFIPQWDINKAPILLAEQKPKTARPRENALPAYRWRSTTPALHVRSVRWWGASVKRGGGVGLNADISIQPSWSSIRQQERKRFIQEPPLSLRISHLHNQRPGTRWAERNHSVHTLTDVRQLLNKQNYTQS